MYFFIYFSIFDNQDHDDSEPPASDQNGPPATLPRHLQSGVIVISGRKGGGGSGIVTGSNARRRASVGGRSNSSAGGSSNGGSIGGNVTRKQSSGGGEAPDVTTAPRRKGKFLAVQQPACLPGAFDDCLPGQAPGMDADGDDDIMPYMSVVEDAGDRPSLMASSSSLGPPRKGFFTSKSRVAPLPSLLPRLDSE